MSKENNDFRLGMMFTKEQTKKINEMAESMNFSDLSDFIYYLIDKEYTIFIQDSDSIWSKDLE
jgi:hypothetical protein